MYSFSFATRFFIWFFLGIDYQDMFLVNSHLKGSVMSHVWQLFIFELHFIPFLTRSNLICVCEKSFFIFFFSLLNINGVGVDLSTLCHVTIMGNTPYTTGALLRLLLKLLTKWSNLRNPTIKPHPHNSHLKKRVTITVSTKNPSYNRVWAPN